MPTATQATPSVSIDSAGLITASAVQAAGYVAAGTKNGTLQLTTQAATTITPTKSEQTAVTAGKYTTGAVKVAAIPADYISTTDATAAAANILTGKTAYVNGSKITGTMANNGAQSATLTTSTTSKTIPAGYTSGGTVSISTETKSVTPTKSAQTVTPTSGKVLSSVSVAAIPASYITTSDANATAVDIVTSKTAYVNGSKITGTNPYVKSTTDTAVETQGTLIEQVASILTSKVGTSSGSGDTSDATA